MLIKLWLTKLFRPRNQEAETRQQELILNILLAFSLLGFAILNIIRIIDVLTNPKDRGLPLMATLLIFLFFVFLLILSKRGWLKTAAWLLIVVYSLPMFYSFILWGTDLPAALLLAVLIITLSGILIGPQLVLIATAAISGFLIILTYLQENNIVIERDYWRAEQHEMGDAITYAVLMMIIALIAWLFARGISRALRRAQESETQLKQERDSLEIRVLERTQQLRQSETEKLNQLYRLAEFGRLSSGIFHDLINPLTAIALNLEQVNGHDELKIFNAQSCLNQALVATHKMEGLIASIKKQIQLEGRPLLFSLNEEIREIIQIFSYKARRAGVIMTFQDNQEVQIYGDPIKFWQIVSNLLSNAIEASEALTAAKEGGSAARPLEVQIKLTAQYDAAIITISDQGIGIHPDHITKIFEPFFSTKKEAGQGLGLGLASTKSITEKCFAGTITVTSQLGQGSEFTVRLPLNLPAHAH
jgi:signal transduction histidine kinase